MRRRTEDARIFVMPYSTFCMTVQYTIGSFEMGGLQAGGLAQGYKMMLVLDVGLHRYILAFDKILVLLYIDD